MRRLGTDYVDLYLLHHRDEGTPPAAIAEVMQDLVAAGKTRYWGLSNHSAAETAAFLKAFLGLFAMMCVHLVTLRHVGFDGAAHNGRLVVHADVVDDVRSVFRRLYRAGFAIRRMRLVDSYGASDRRSMAANNSSAYNCRVVEGSTSWSAHAYGRAIDVNPRLNPFVDRRGDYQPANAAPWVDRTRTEPGMLHDGDAAVLAFTDRGWTWGGHWRTPLDYQHFELP